MRTLAMIAIASASLALSSLGAEAAPGARNTAARWGVPLTAASTPSSSVCRLSVAIGGFCSRNPFEAQPRYSRQWQHRRD
jgi:hypothetical protein